MAVPQNIFVSYYAHISLFVMFYAFPLLSSYQWRYWSSCDQKLMLLLPLRDWGYWSHGKEFVCRVEGVWKAWSCQDMHFPECLITHLNKLLIKKCIKWSKCHRFSLVVGTKERKENKISYLKILKEFWLFPYDNEFPNIILYCKYFLC